MSIIYPEKEENDMEDIYIFFYVYGGWVKCCRSYAPTRTTVFSRVR